MKTKMKMKTLKSKLKEAYLKFKNQVLQFWLKIPFGSICSFEYGKQKISVTKNLWVIVSDGKSSDALPINFVSQQLVSAIEAEMTRMGYRCAEPTPKGA